MTSYQVGIQFGLPLGNVSLDSFLRNGTGTLAFAQNPCSAPVSCKGKGSLKLCADVRDAKVIQISRSAWVPTVICGP